MKRIAWVMLALLMAPLKGPLVVEPSLGAAHPATLHYLSPANGSQFVQPDATLALRLDGPIDPASLSAALFSVVGAVSGSHTGQALLADDGRTVVFKPKLPFTPNEQVSLAIERGLMTQAGAVYSGLQAQFHISPIDAASRLKMNNAQWAAEMEDTLPALNQAGRLATPTAPNAVAAHPQDYVTFPHDFPTITVTTPASGTSNGLLFTAPFSIAGGRTFLSIMDNTGEPVYWKSTVASFSDFTQQSDGTLTYMDTVDFKFHVLDSTYAETRTIAAVGSLPADPHDLQISPDGHALLLIYDPEITDTLAFGGSMSATVTGLVIQELDSQGLEVFHWDSWSHFALSDTYVSLSTPQVDYVHANALAYDSDGNILLSSRHLSEITKIDHETGNIIWRLGGKNNEFTFKNDPDKPFSFQHDIRRLPNGNLTLFDNHNPGPFSRAVEYQIDESNKVVTNTWQFRNTPDNYDFATGNAQRLPDGHTLIDWGISHPNVTEVLTDSTKLFEMVFQPDYFTYRAFRFPWAAVPYWAPTLVLTTSLSLTPTLYYSWNGATDVASYEIYGGAGPQPQTLIGTQTRTGFEDQTPLVGVLPSFCSFRIRPINHASQPQQFSNVVYRSTPCDPAADVGVTASVNTSTPPPGQTVTFTLSFNNAGPSIAPSVILTNIVPSNLTGITYTSSGAALTPFGLNRYAWQVADLAPSAGGVVTITGVLNGGLHGTVFTNTATITTAYTDTNTANNSSTISLTVANVAPLAAGDGYTVTGTAPFTVTAPGVLGNDVDANNDVLTVTLSASPLTGTLSLNPDGSFMYTAPLGFTGPVSFTYQTSDGLLLSPPAMVMITVQAYHFFLPIIRKQSGPGAVGQQ